MTPDIDHAAVGDRIMSVGAAFGVIITGAGAFRARRIEAGLLNAGSDFGRDHHAVRCWAWGLRRLRQGRLHRARRAARRGPVVSHLGASRNRARRGPSLGDTEFAIRWVG